MATINEIILGGVLLTGAISLNQSRTFLVTKEELEKYLFVMGCLDSAQEIKLGLYDDFENENKEKGDDTNFL